VSKGRQPSEYGDSENQRREEEERATSGPTPPNKHANVVTISRTSAQIPSRPPPPSSRIRHQHLTRVCLRPVPHRKSTTKLTIYPPLHPSLQSHHPHPPLSLLSPSTPNPHLHPTNPEMSAYTSTHAGFQTAMQWSLTGPGSETSAYAEATVLPTFYHVMNGERSEYDAYVKGVAEWRDRVEEYVTKVYVLHYPSLIVCWLGGMGSGRG
jgi:hypothetical protein